LREDFLERHPVRIVAKGAKGLDFSHMGLGRRFQQLEKHSLYQPHHHNPKVRATKRGGSASGYAVTRELRG
jgi:hypothetical protein